MFARWCRRIALLAVGAMIVLPVASFADEKKMQVLIIDGQNNHDWKATTPVLQHALESNGRFAVDVSTSPPPDASTEEWDQWRPQFDEYDTVVSNYNGQMWPEPLRDSFVRYVRSGGGFVVIHAANNAFGDWDEYNRIIGLGGWGGRNERHGSYVYYEDGEVVRDDSQGAGGRHGSQHEFVVEVRDPDHPITKDMPARWLHAKDELYDKLRGPALNMNILATSYADPKTGGSGRHEPIIMTIRYGRGRVFHTPMDHADYSMRCAGFYTVVQRGTEWTATGEVTISIPEDFPTDRISEEPAGAVQAGG